MAAWSEGGLLVAVAPSGECAAYGIDGRLVQRFDPPGQTVVGLVVSQDGLACVLDRHEGLSVWDLRSGSCVGHSIVHGGAALAVCPYGVGVVATLAETGIVQEWKLSPLACRREAQVAGTQFTALAYSPDGRFLVLGNGTEIVVWDAGMWKVRTTTPATGFESSPLDARVTVHEPTGRTRILDLETARFTAELRESVGARDFSWSPDGNFVLGNVGEAIRVWSADTGMSLMDMTGAFCERPMMLVDGTVLGFGWGLSVFDARSFLGSPADLLGAQPLPPWWVLEGSELTRTGAPGIR